MVTNNFDVVVVGTGAAGLCCAASIAEAGRRVVLVPDGNAGHLNPRDDAPIGRLLVEALYYQHGWDGGAWVPLARRLNLAVKFSVDPLFQMTVHRPGGPQAPFDAPLCASPAALAEYLIGAFENVGLDMHALHADYEGVLAQLLAIDLPRLSTYSSVLFADWLEQQKAHPLIGASLNAYCANLLFTPHDLAIQHTSVAAIVGAVRAIMMGQGCRVSIFPNARDGLFELLASAIEARGGSVLREAPVAQVLVEGDVARGVVLGGGREVRAGATALATPTARANELLNALPSVVTEAADYQSQLVLDELFVSTPLDRPVVTSRAMCYVSDETGNCVEVVHPIHLLAPWAAPKGEQLVVTQSYRRAGPGAGEDTVDHRDAVTGDVFPGFLQASQESTVWREERHSLAAYCSGPRLPRRTDDIPNLWFVAEGAGPVTGLLGTEAAAGAGVAGARDILAALG